MTVNWAAAAVGSTAAAVRQEAVAATTAVAGERGEVEIRETAGARRAAVMRAVSRVAATRAVPVAVATREVSQAAAMTEGGTTGEISEGATTGVKMAVAAERSVRMAAASGPCSCSWPEAPGRPRM